MESCFLATCDSKLVLFCHDFPAATSGQPSTVQVYLFLPLASSLTSSHKTKTKLILASSKVKQIWTMKSSDQKGWIQERDYVAPCSEGRWMTSRCVKILSQNLFLVTLLSTFWGSYELFPEYNLFGPECHNEKVLPGPAILGHLSPLQCLTRPKSLLNTLGHFGHLEGISPVLIESKVSLSTQ